MSDSIIGSPVEPAAWRTEINWAVSVLSLAMAKTEPAAGPPFAVRCVVTGHDEGGRAVIVADGVPPATVTSPMGHGLADLLWLPQPPTGPGDGSEPAPDIRGGFPADGAIACRLIRFPGYPPGTAVEDTWLRVMGDDPDRPGMHRSQTLDLMVVLEGFITLGLDDGEHPLGPGDAVVQRGTMHRWRVVGARPCTFLSVLLSPVPGVQKPSRPLEPSSLGTDSAVDADGPRRVVTGTFSDGSSGIMLSGVPTTRAAASAPDGVSLYDFWQTGGPLTDVGQGGDVPGPWQLEPAGGGVAFRRVDFGAGHDPGDAGLHATHTIDVGVVLSGAVELDLGPDTEPTAATRTILRRGDVVIQRATAHRWRPVSGEPAVLVSVMIGLPVTAAPG